MTLEGTTKQNKRGNTVTETFVENGDRYMFDFNLCRSSDGWINLETQADAPYFGVWVHPEKLETMQYVEGDVYHTVCATADTYAQEIDDLIACYGVAPGFTTIDENGEVIEHYQSRDSYLSPKPSL